MVLPAVKLFRQHFQKLFLPGFGLGGLIVPRQLSKQMTRMNQERHHQNQSFKEEYLEILRKNEIAFKNEYVFDFFEEVVMWE